MINGIKPEVSVKTQVDNKDDYSTALSKMVHRIDEKYGEYYKKTLVEKTTGNVYKSASWRAPYTKGNNPVRGSIYDTSTYWDKQLNGGGWLYV